jgi:hypothetical protein
MRPEIRRLTPEQFLSLLVSVRPGLARKITSVHRESGLGIVMAQPWQAGMLSRVTLPDCRRRR